MRDPHLHNKENISFSPNKEENFLAQRKTAPKRSSEHQSDEEGEGTSSPKRGITSNLPPSSSSPSLYIYIYIHIHIHWCVCFFSFKKKAHSLWRGPRHPFHCSMMRQNITSKQQSEKGTHTPTTPSPPITSNHERVRYVHKNEVLKSHTLSLCWLSSLSICDTPLSQHIGTDPLPIWTKLPLLLLLQQMQLFLAAIASREQQRGSGQQQGTTTTQPRPRLRRLTFLSPQPKRPNTFLPLVPPPPPLRLRLRLRHPHPHHDYNQSLVSPWWAKRGSLSVQRICWTCYNNISYNNHTMSYVNLLRKIK